VHIACLMAFRVSDDLLCSIQHTLTSTYISWISDEGGEAGNGNHLTLPDESSLPPSTNVVGCLLDFVILSKRICLPGDTRLTDCLGVDRLQSPLTCTVSQLAFPQDLRLRVLEA
jgi:hypothetical protein